jgi:hypothetical protein
MFELEWYREQVKCDVIAVVCHTWCTQFIRTRIEKLCLSQRLERFIACSGGILLDVQRVPAKLQVARIVRTLGRDVIAYATTQAPTRTIREVKL